VDAVVITGVHGLVAGATAPVFMELSGEVTHTVSEEVPANLIGLFINFTHVAAFVFFTYVQDLTWLCAFVLGMCCAYCTHTVLVLYSYSTHTVLYTVLYTGTYVLCLLVYLPVACSCVSDAVSFCRTTHAVVRNYR
jgi:hypothetical protein